ncbi:MAG TPA: hypothetical protein VJU87_01370, partial [Gemmatimonadaceae bacterium]|nr:hypothetical protein [Gemmatimonadaceae bacterium]
MSPAQYRIGRVLLGIVTAVLGLVALAAIVVVVLTATDWGHERIRRLALGQFGHLVHGQLSIGRISGNLLTGMTLHDVSIRDSTGAPFVAAEEISAKYALGALLGKKIWLSDVTVVRPTIVLDRPPGGEWNYQRIFPRSANNQPNQPPGFGSWIKLENVTVVDGHLIVLSPWHPNAQLSAAAQDSVARAALDGASRLMVVRAPTADSGQAPYQKVVELRAIDAKLPLLLLAEPNAAHRLARVASLRMTALPFRPPAAVVTDMRGDFPFDNDSLWWHGVQATLPASRVSGDGSYAFSSGDMMLKLRGTPAALADLRWLYPRLPSEGQGTLDFALRWHAGIDDYTATNADVRVGDTRVQGSFGLTLSDTFALHDTDLRFANFDTRLAEQLIPGFQSPRRGTLTGQAAVNGGKHALRVDGDVAFSDGRTGTSRVAANGFVGMLEGGGLHASDLRLQLHPVQVELAKAFVHSGTPLPVSGVVTGTGIVNGTTRTQLVALVDVTHDDRGDRSHLNGRAAVRLPVAGGTPWLDVNVVARPLSLAEVGRFAPAAGLQGSAAGPIHLVGTLGNLRLASDLRLPDGGQLVSRGALDLSGATKGYDLAVGMKVFNLRTVLAKAPTTSLTLQATGKGVGFSPATMRAAFAADFSASKLDSIALDSGTVRVAIANGLATVQRLQLLGSHAVVQANGAFGLAAARSGTLTYRVAVDSVGALDRLLPHTSPDTGAVPPRPGL